MYWTDNDNGNISIVSGMGKSLIYENYGTHKGKFGNYALNFRKN